MIRTGVDRRRLVRRGGEKDAGVERVVRLVRFRDGARIVRDDPQRQRLGAGRHRQDDVLEHPGRDRTARWRRAEQARTSGRIAVVERDRHARRHGAAAAVADPRRQTDRSLLVCRARERGDEIRFGELASCGEAVLAEVVVDLPVVRLARGDRGVVVDVRDVVRVLVPDAPCRHPPVVAVDLDAGWAGERVVVARHDDFGAPVTVDVDDDGHLVRRAARPRRLPQHDAIAAAVDAQLQLVGVDHLDRAVPLEVEYRGAGDVRAVVLDHGLPLDGPVGLENDVAARARDADLRLSVVVEVAHGRRADSAAARHRHRAPLDRAGVLEEPYAAPGDQHDLRKRISVEVGDSVEAIRQRGVAPQDRAGCEVGRVAGHHLRTAIHVDIGHDGERPDGVVSAAACPRPANRAVGVEHLTADDDLRHAVAVEIGDRGAAPVDGLENRANPLGRAVVLDGDDSVARLVDGEDLGPAVDVDVANRD